MKIPARNGLIAGVLLVLSLSLAACQTSLFF